MVETMEEARRLMAEVAAEQAARDGGPGRPQKPRTAEPSRDDIDTLRRAKWTAGRS